MAISWNKKERDNKKKQERKQKAEKKKERKEQSAGKKGMDDMMAYLDENGNLTSVPPNPNNKKIEYNLDDIEISVPKQEELSPEDLVRKGIITFFNSAKGFGFIEDGETRERVFVHQSSANMLLQEGMHISFEIEKGPKGYTAVNVQKETK